MSLTTCPDCRRQISTRARACPGCGAPSAKYLRKKAIKSRGQYQALGCLSLLIGIPACFFLMPLGLFLVFLGIVSTLAGLAPVIGPISTRNKSK
jgi:hypothetical protein